MANAKTPELQPFHFFGSSLCTWKTDADIKVVQRVLDREKEYPYALRLAGVHVLSSAVLASDTEPTLVADILPALSAERAHLIADALEQEAIAQRVDGVGELHGPAARLWRPFNPAYFLDLSQDAARAA